MVLFVFVIMLLNVRTEEAKPDQQKYLKWLAVPLLIALLSEVLIVVKVMNIPPPDLPQTGDPSQIIGTTESIGHGMFSSYLLPFEAASVLILMAIVGAMLLARREPMPKLESAGEAAQQAPSQPSESQTIQEEVVAAGHH
jgi:NADH:ubiquinone oxidoreductase subunit 6 (subunit J)